MRSLALHSLAALSIAAGFLASQVEVPVFRTEFELPVRLARHASASHRGAAWVFGGVTAAGESSACYYLAVGANAWRAGPPLPSARTDAGAASVGGRLLVFGGRKRGKISSEVLELVQGRWKAISSLPKGLANFAHAVVGSKLYVLGGYRDAGVELPSSVVFVFDAATSKWSTLAPLPAARVSHCAFPVNGKIYLAGGKDSNGKAIRTSWTLDLKSGKWTQEPSPASDQIEEHVDAVATLDASGNWLLVGGSGTGARCSERLLVEHGTLRFRASTPPPFAVAHAAAAPLPSGGVLSGGQVLERPRKDRSAASFRIGKERVTTVEEGVATGFPLATLVSFPRLVPGRRYPLIVFGHGILDRAIYYRQLSSQLCAAGFLVAVPDCRTCNKTPLFGDMLLKTARAMQKSFRYAPFLDGRVIVGGFSAGGGGAILAAKKLSACALFAVSPWVGCVPPQSRCKPTPEVILAAKQLDIPVYLIAMEKDPLGTRANAAWISESLQKARRLRVFHTLAGSIHGGASSGQGAADVVYVTGQEGRRLQERVFRNVLAFLRAVVLDSAKDPKPVVLERSGAGFEVLLEAGQDPRLKAQEIEFMEPGLFVSPAVAAKLIDSLEVGIIGRPKSPYLLLLSVPKAGATSFAPFGTFLLDPGSFHSIPGYLPASGHAKIPIPLPAAIRGSTLHLQGFGLDPTSAVGFALSAWRRSTRI